MIFDKMLISNVKENTEFSMHTSEGIGFEIAEKAEEDNIRWREYSIEHVIRDTWG